MKVLVTHKKSGKIVNLAIPNPASARKVAPRASKGHAIAEIEISSLELGAKDLDRRLSELMERFKIRNGNHGAELVEIKK